MRLLCRLWKLCFGWLLVHNTHRLTTAGAIYVPSLGIRWDGNDLTAACKESITKAIELYRQKRAPIIILSHAYGDYWKQEMKLKLRITDAAGIPRNAIEHLTPLSDQNFTSSQTEIERLGVLIKQRGMDTEIILVAQEWHMRRQIVWARRIAPWINFEPVNVRTPYESHLAVPRLKGLTTANGIWQGWNIFCLALTPFFFSVSHGQIISRPD